MLLFGAGGYAPHTSRSFRPSESTVHASDSTSNIGMQPREYADQCGRRASSSQPPQNPRDPGGLQQGNNPGQFKFQVPPRVYLSTA